MKRIQIVFFTAIFVSLVLSGCKSLNPSVMLKVPKDFKYSTFPSTQQAEYKIALNDEITFSIFSNDGFKLIDVTTLAGEKGGSTRLRTEGGLSYAVEFDGTVKLPLLGRTTLNGLTVREAETLLEEKYSSFYNKPYVLLEVTNMRVMVFPGMEGAARIVNLKSENTTLIEALALTGGIAKTGKAYKVKLIRGGLKNPEVYLVDLSTLDGVRQADLVLQANDIIYIEPKLGLSRDVMTGLLPYLSFITTMVFFYEFVKRKT